MNLFFLTFTIASSLDSYFDDKYVKHITSKEIRFYIEKPDYLTVLFLYDILQYKGITLGEILLPLLPKYKHFIKFYAVSCEHDPNFCTPEVKFDLPSIQAYIPRGINPLTDKLVVHEEILENEISQATVLNFFDSNIPYLGDFVDKTYLDKFLSYENNKILLFSKEDEVITEFKVLSSKYWGRAEFGVVYINQTELLDRFEIYRFPSVVAVSGEEVHHYDGIMDFVDLVKFVERFKAAEKKQLRPRRLLSEYFDKENLVYLPEFPVVNSSVEGFEQVLAQDSEVVLAHFWKNNQHPLWKNFQDKYSGVVKLVNLRIESLESETLAKDLGVKKFPSLRIFPSNRKRKSFELNISTRDELEEELAREIKTELQILQDSTLNYFIEAVKAEWKVGFLLVSQGKIPLQIKALAKIVEFKSFAKFAYFNKPKDQAFMTFAITKFPSFVAVIKPGSSSNLRILEYNGRLTDYKSLYYFIDELALPTLLPKAIPKPLEEDLDSVPMLRSSEQFSKACLKSSSICAFSVFDGNPEHLNLITVSTLQAYSSTRRFALKFFSVNGKCHTEFLNSFNQEHSKLPVFFLLDPQKRSFCSYFGKFIYEDMSRFIDNFLRGKENSTTAANPQFEDKLCKDDLASKESIKKNKSKTKRQESDL